jgi:hypothetical protein
MVCTLHGVGDVEHHQHAMTATAAALFAEPSALYRGAWWAHMWTAADLQDVGQRFDQIACVHMSGLLMRPHMNAGQDGFRDTDSKQLSDQQAAIGPIGVFRVVDQSITPSAHYFASSGIGSARLQFCCSPCLADL